MANIDYDNALHELDQIISGEVTPEVLMQYVANEQLERIAHNLECLLIEQQVSPREWKLSDPGTNL